MIIIMQQQIHLTRMVRMKFFRNDPIIIMIMVVNGNHSMMMMMITTNRKKTKILVYSKKQKKITTPNQRKNNSNISYFGHCHGKYSDLYIAIIIKGGLFLVQIVAIYICLRNSWWSLLLMLMMIDFFLYIESLPPTLHSIAE